MAAKPIGRPQKKRTVTPQRAVEILAKHGTHLTLEQAEKALELVYKLAKLSLRIYVKEENY